MRLDRRAITPPAAVVVGRKSYILSAMSASPHSSSDERILLIRPTALGDVARTVPALVSLRAAFPHARIDWLVHDAFVDVVKHHPALTSVIPFPRSRFGQAWRSASALGELRRWIQQLRATRYTRVIDLQGLFRSGAITRLTGAPRRIGYANARELGWLGYNEKHNIDPALHAVDRMLALVAAHGVPISHDMTLYVGKDDQRWLEQLRAEHQITDTDGGFFVVAPTARWRCKCWPIDRYAALTGKILDSGRAGSKVVLLAAPNETAAVAPFVDALRGTGRVITPATSVGKMMAILRAARLVLCNDSAPLHIAVGFSRPIVTIFGPTDPALVGPYRRNETIVQPPDLTAMGPRAYRQANDDQTLISRVTIDAVWAKIESQLSPSG